MPAKRKSWYIASILLVVAVVLATLLRNKNQNEPTYKGLPLSRWIAVTSSTSDLNKGLAEIGPQSIPYLCRAIRTRDNPVQSSWCRVWRRLPASTRVKFRSHAPIEARAIRRNALWGLRFWGPEASEALPDLKELALFEGDLMNKTLLYHATVEVGGNSPVALAAIHAWLTNREAIVRSQAAGAIFDSPIHDSTSLSLLIDNADRSPTPAYNELLAFGSIGPKAAAALPVIIGALTNSVTRNNALTALAGSEHRLAPRCRR